MTRIAIFASGSGTNAENIIKYFQNSEQIRVSKVYCNKKGAGVFARCERLNVPCVWFSREAFYDSSRVLHDVQLHADFVVLAGFLAPFFTAFLAGSFGAFVTFIFILDL